MKRKELTEEELEKLTVKLKPLFGIEPGRYLTGLYIILLAAVLFLILVFPGIRKNGTLYDINSYPADASVYVDGVRVGATPCRVFMKKGERTVVLTTPYHETHTETLKVKGRILASRFFPRKGKLAFPLTLGVNDALMRERHREIVSWYQSDEGYASYPLPPLMQEAGTAFFRSAGSFDADRRESFRPFLLSTLRNAATKTALADWTAGYGLYASRGRVATPANLLTAALEGAEFLKEHPETIAFFDQSFPLGSLEVPEKAVTGDSGLLALSHEAPVKPDYADPLAFVPVKWDSDSYYYIADRELTKRWYARFIQENPEWAPEKTAALAAAGLADERYLSDWTAGTDYSESQEPLRFVSRHAAAAFCDWLNEAWQPFPGWEVRLPTEMEWENAAIRNGLTSRDRPSQKNLGPLTAGSYKPGFLDLYDMEGNLWEWCSGGFGTNDNFFYNTIRETGNYAEAFPEAAVRGGSWANDPGKVQPVTRGSQPAEWSTPYIGFRPVLAPVRG